MLRSAQVRAKFAKEIMARFLGYAWVRSSAPVLSKTPCYVLVSGENA